MLVLDTAERTVTFRGLPPRCVPSLFRGFSAPVRVRSNLDDAERLVLLAHDSDGFNRWEAAQTTVSRLVIGGMAGDARIAAQGEVLLRTAIGSALGDATADAAFAAQVLTWPTEADLAREVGADVDPDAIRDGRERLRRSVGSGLSEPMTALYGTLSEPRPFTPDAASAGRRALRAALLGYLAAADHARGAALAAAQFAAADNMTDRFAALVTACALPLANREAMLHQFYEMFAGDALVIDKWLGVQAGIAEPQTLDRVQRLMQHPAFSLGNPNRVYALIGGFAANQTQFNRPDGAGYALLVDVVLELDPKNPQVAARLLNAFRSWRLMEPGRRGKAEAALRRIAERNALSADVRDIVDRCLA